MTNKSFPYGLPLEGIPLAGSIGELKAEKIPAGSVLPGVVTVTIDDIDPAHIIAASGLDGLSERTPLPETTWKPLIDGVGSLSLDASKIVSSKIQGLPVAGYEPEVDAWKVEMVNENKILEERVLRRVDQHVRNRDSQEIDQASVQIARRHVEDAFYRLNRAIMHPKRIALPEDAA